MLKVGKIVRRVLLVILCCSATVAWAVPNPESFRKEAQETENRIKALAKEGKWSEVEKETTKFIAMMREKTELPEPVTLIRGKEETKNGITVNTPDIHIIGAVGGSYYRAIYDEFIARAYPMKANAQANQGKYNAAANTIRESHAWKADSKNLKLVMDYQDKSYKQREYYNKTTELHQKMIVMNKEINKLAKQKKALVDAMLKKDKVTKKELESLQAELKKLNAAIADQKTKIKETMTQFNKDVAEYREAKIVFSQAQSSKIQELARESENIMVEFAKNEKATAEGLIKITEKFNISWEGLEATLTKMKEVQLKIMDIQKAMLALLEKSSLSDAEKTELKNLKSQLAKLMSQHEKLMSDIEQSFMDSKVFQNLSTQEQKRFYELFKVIRDAGQVISKNNGIIEKLMKKLITAKYGDFNNDGKIDQKDLDMLRNYLSTIDRLRPGMDIIWDPNMNFDVMDLDGDKSISWADYELLNEAVNGDRKFFPVDPKNPKGDLNGNGSFDLQDIRKIIEIMLNPEKYAGGIVRVADINGDGSIDYTDVSALIELVKNQDEPQPVPVPSVGGLCHSCSQRMFITNVGKCSRCGSSTSSGSFKYCRKCSGELGKCMACGRSLFTKDLSEPATGTGETTGQTIDQSGEGTTATSMDQTY